MLKIYVKGKLQRNIDFRAKSLKAPENISNVVKKGYKLPFVQTPEKRFFANNKSAQGTKQFVSESLADLLKDNSVIEADYISDVVNPICECECSREAKNYS